MTNRHSQIANSRFPIPRKLLRWTGLLMMTLMLAIATHLPATAATARHYTELEFEPLSEIQVPEYTRYELDNGMVVYLMEDRELPLVNGTMLIRTGDRFEPADQVGLATLVGTVMRTGGTTEHTGEELNQLLEQRAAFVETGISTAAGSASFGALSEDLESVFALFAEVIRQPAFDPEKLALAKTQLAGQIARRNDDPGDIASREFQKLIYGENSPYARTVEYATLDNIARDDLLAFYNDYFHPETTILGISGDFDSEQMRSLIQEQFGDWKPAATSSVPPIPDASQAKEGGLFFVDRPQLTQSYVQMGHIGGQLDNPDYFALDVLNSVMNGFGGRLFNEVRSRQGLAYSVYGYWSPRYDYPGMFIAGGQTRSEATVPLIQAIEREIEELRTTPITAEELAYAKEGTLNSFVFNFQDPDQTLSRLMRYEYYGYPEDFLFRYQEGVEATTVEDVQRVAQTYLQPEQIVTLVVGNREAIQPPLTSLSTNVTSLDVTIPEPKSS